MKGNAGRRDATTGALQRRVEVSSGPVQLQGLLELPAAPRGIVVFAHGAGASHLLERPGALGTVASLAAAWFARHLPRALGERVRRA